MTLVQCLKIIVSYILTNFLVFKQNKFKPCYSVLAESRFSMRLLRWAILASDLSLASDEVSWQLHYKYFHLLPTSFHTGVTENTPPKTICMQMFIFRSVHWRIQQQQQKTTLLIHNSAYSLPSIYLFHRKIYTVT